ncbi:MAG: hypothetical protein AAF548_19485 [Actinomycetota bacterium]
MISRRTPLFLLAGALVLAACNADDPAATDRTPPESASTPDATDPSPTSIPVVTAPPPAEPPDEQPSDDSDDDSDDESDRSESATDAMVDAALAGLARAYERADGVWNGFVPNEHPAVMVFKDDDDGHVATIAINHPDPDALGKATELDRSSFGSVHRIDDVADPEYYEGLDAFDFHAQLGGVDSFAMVAGGSDEFFDPAQPDWASTWLHELFHRYQDAAFAPDDAGQDIEGYDYSADNIRLAVLEERALAAALRTDDADERLAAARHFAGLRVARLAADPRVVLDQGQERLEGTARYVEHRFAADDTAYTYHDANYDRELDLGLTDGTKDHFGFGRFYGTGAAVLRLATLVGVDGDSLTDRIEAGEAPAEVLVDVLGITESDSAAIVAEAGRTYDTDGALMAEAEAAAARAVDEPPVFGDGDTGEASGGDDGFALTDDDLDCLAEQGVDLQNDDVIPDGAFDACLAGSP